MEEIENHYRSQQFIFSFVGLLLLIVAVTGFTVAFFNYTRNGPDNTVGTGQMEFTTSQAVTSVSNLVPINSNTVTSSTTSNVATTVVTINGWTNYKDGIDYTVTIEDIDFKGLPIKIKAFKEGETTNSAILTDYTSSLVTNGSVIASGNIAKSDNEPEVIPTGTIIIKAYLDDDKVVITDTASSDYIGGGFENGTNVPNGVVRLTTEEWNNLALNPATFKVKVVAVEG